MSLGHKKKPDEVGQITDVRTGEAALTVSLALQSYKRIIGNAREREKKLHPGLTFTV